MAPIAACKRAYRPPTGATEAAAAVIMTATLLREVVGCHTDKGLVRAQASA